MTDRELMQMAMETIQGCRPSSKSYKQMRETVEALRERLSQPEPEPVAWLWNKELFWAFEYEAIRKEDDDAQPLYIAPPKREWVGLTDEEIYDYADKFLYQHGSNYGIKSFGKAIEAKLKEKNT